MIQTKNEEQGFCSGTNMISLQAYGNLFSTLRRGSSLKRLGYWDYWWLVKPYSNSSKGLCLRNKWGGSKRKDSLFFAMLQPTRGKLLATHHQSTEPECLPLIHLIDLGCLTMMATILWPLTSPWCMQSVILMPLPKEVGIFSSLVHSGTPLHQEEAFEGYRIMWLPSSKET